MVLTGIFLRQAGKLRSGKFGEMGSRKFGVCSQGSRIIKGSISAFEQYSTERCRAHSVWSYSLRTELCSSFATGLRLRRALAPSSEA